MSDKHKIYLYRMTHIDNVPHILDCGVTHAASINANPKYKAIGDSTLIDVRSTVMLANSKMLGSYIPFYFGPRMPMLYVIQKGYNNVQPVPPEKIVYCITTIQQIVGHNLPCLFTDGHATNGLSHCYDRTKLDQIHSIIDKQAITAKEWVTDLDLKRRKQAEFLIGCDLPASCIVGWVVYSETAKHSLLSIGVQKSKIAIRPGYYF